MESTHHPFRTIVRKEWRQTAELRRSVLLIGALLPPFVLLMAEAASRGWFPALASIDSYSMRDVILLAVPVVMVGAWGVLALFVCAQTFAGDRAAGAESFLLERPVSRRVIWAARLFSTVSNALFVIMSGWLIWAGYCLALARPLDDVFLNSSNPTLGFGVLLVLVAICGGLVSSTFFGSPMPAFLVGLIVAPAPFGLAYLFFFVPPYAVVGEWPVGWVVPLLLFPAFVFTSYWGMCLGEPNGRGRIRRASTVLGGAGLLVLGLFLTLSTLVVRANVNAGLSSSGTFPSPSPGRSILLGGEDAPAGWLVDTNTGKKLKFLSGPVRHVAWSRDGERFVLLLKWESFGPRDGARRRIVVFDAEKGQHLGDWRLPQDHYAVALTWVGEDIFFLKDLDRENGVQLMLAGPGADGWEKPGQLHVRPVETELPLFPEVLNLDFFHVDDEFTLFHIIVPRIQTEHIEIEEETEAERFQRLMSFSLHRTRLIGDRLEMEAVFTVQRDPWWNEFRLAPSGRYWWYSRDNSGKRMNGLDIYDLTTEIRHLYRDVSDSWIEEAVWLAGDELLWVGSDGTERSLWSWMEGRGPLVLGHLGSTGEIQLVPSPDRKQLLITRRTKDMTNWIYRAGSSSVEPFESGYREGVSRWSASWADPGRLVWGSGRDIWFEAVDNPGKLTKLR